MFFFGPPHLALNPPLPVVVGLFCFFFAFWGGVFLAWFLFVFCSENKRKLVFLKHGYFGLFLVSPFLSP